MSPCTFIQSFKHCFKLIVFANFINITEWGGFFRSCNFFCDQAGTHNIRNIVFVYLKILAIIHLMHFILIFHHAKQKLISYVSITFIFNFNWNLPNNKYNASKIDNSTNTKWYQTLKVTFNIFIVEKKLKLNLKSRINNLFCIILDFKYCRKNCHICFR